MRWLTVLVLAALLAGCSTESDEQVLATFEGGVLTVADVDAHLKSLKRDSRFREKQELLTPAFAFEHALNMEMIIACGLELDLHRDPVIRNELHDSMSRLFMELLQDQLIEQIDRDTITEEEMRAFYEENLEQYQQPARYHLHAFSVDPEQAEQVLAAVLDGRLEFATAAGRHALKEKERRSGGDTGKRTLRRFQPSWREIVATLPVGEASGPHLIDGETYLLLLESRTEPYQNAFEERREYIRNDVLYSRYQQQWQEVYDELRHNYRVKIDRKRLERYITAEPGDNGVEALLAREEGRS
ncbi:MAG: peptidyl-prolyl cis-trans isomerase [Desulfobulbaceae bacterium]|nr:peptidyl-prolyl cis-trans isomerase [Desulfobulbaceae bacterium]